MVASTLSLGGVSGFVLIGQSLTGGSEMMDQYLISSSALLQEVIFFYCIIYRGNCDRPSFLLLLDRNSTETHPT